MEARMAKVEAGIEHIQSDIVKINGDLRDIKVDVREIRNEAREDFRLLFGALILSSLGLAALMAKGFHWF